MMLALEETIPLQLLAFLTIAVPLASAGLSPAHDRSPVQRVARRSPALNGVEAALKRAAGEDAGLRRP